MPIKPSVKSRCGLIPALSILIVLCLAGIMAQDRPVFAETPAKNAIMPQLEEKIFAQGTLYTLVVPADGPYRVAPALVPTLATIESPQWRASEPGKSALFLINGGFFDPNNRMTISYVVQNGKTAADPRKNPQLTGNEKLKPYLPKIFNRSEFRVYECAGQVSPVQYDIAPHDAPVPQGCALRDALGGGPALLPVVNDQAEAFTDYDAQGKLTRDPIGVCAKNARSVVGLTETGDVIILMGAQDPASPKTTGFSLADMAGLLRARGAVKAMALDGGSSSGLMYAGKTVYGRFNANGSPVKRPVKSILMVSPKP